MSSFPSAALQSGPYDPVSQLGKALQYKGMQQEQQIRGAQLTGLLQENKQREIAMQNQKKLSAAYMKAGGDLGKAADLYAADGGDPETVTKLKTADAQQRSATLDLLGKEGTKAISDADLLQGAHDTVAQSPDKSTAYAQQYDALKIAGVDVSKIPPQYPGDEAFKVLGIGVKRHTELIKEQADLVDRQQKAQQAADTHAVSQIDQQQKGRVLAGTSPTGITADQQAQNELTRSGQRLTKRGQDLSHADATAVPETAVDANSQSILAQTGLSQQAFLALTDQSSKLPRDARTRQAAFAEMRKWAVAHGIDTSTLGSQYKTYNETLSKNISRLNNTKIMEQELQGTIQNLQGVVSNKDLGKLRIGNVLDIWAGKEVNDDLAQQYAMHLNQLRTELTAYNAATQGRSGNEITVEDRREADQVIRNGIAKGSLEGLATAVGNSTNKMGNVMENSVNNSRKAIWNLFGVGGNYKGTTSQQAPGGNDPFAQFGGKPRR